MLLVGKSGVSWVVVFLALQEPPFGTPGGYVLLETEVCVGKWIGLALILMPGSSH